MFVYTSYISHSIISRIMIMNTAIIIIHALHVHVEFAGGGRTLLLL